MCFLTISKRKKPRTAIFPIVCYKSVRLSEKENVFFAYFYDKFRYEIGKKYKLDIPLKLKRNPGNNVSIDEGFHSYFYISRVRGSLAGAIVKCIIPRGAKYMKNRRYGEYVSDQIIVKRRV